VCETKLVQYLSPMGDTDLKSKKYMSKNIGYNILVVG
jgi:hypothetical protein